MKIDTVFELKLVVTTWSELGKGSFNSQKKKSGLVHKEDGGMEDPIFGLFLTFFLGRFSQKFWIKLDGIYRFIGRLGASAGSGFAEAN